MRLFWLFAGLTLALGLPARGGEPHRAAPAGRELKTHQVPYLLSATKHIVVRAKINGKGPYHFVLDTGAPALFVSTRACKKLGVAPDKKGWGAFERFEIEGGVVLAKVKGRIEDPFQLEGMNGMGLAGVELHGVIGYNLLARYRIEIDFTRDRMAWTELPFAPVPPQGVGSAAGGAELNTFATTMKILGALMGRRANPQLTPRGFIGVEWSDEDGPATITAVLAKGPAAQAGLQTGDRITAVNGEPIASAAELRQAVAKVAAGTTVKLTVARGGKSHELEVTAGEGL